MKFPCEMDSCDQETVGRFLPLPASSLAREPAPNPAVRRIVTNWLLSDPVVPCILSHFWALLTLATGREKSRRQRGFRDRPSKVQVKLVGMATARGQISCSFRKRNTERLECDKAALLMVSKICGSGVRSCPCPRNHVLESFVEGVFPLSCRSAWLSHHRKQDPEAISLSSIGPLLQ
eukprot:gb/GECG01015116.1/.p2 GENE.gb/GECG01015116.1/~~gb/GECG01015116.1/.p2  ORF type:complete len:177 (-),score=4.23 gb/GECG01015116.1/:77-607(-)